MGDQAAGSRVTWIAALAPGIAASAAQFNQRLSVAFAIAVGPLQMLPVAFRFGDVIEGRADGDDN